MHSFFLTVILSIAPSATSAQPADCADGKQAVEGKKYAEGLTRLKSCLGGNLSNEQRLLFLQVRAKAYHGLNQMSLAIEDQERAVTIDSSNDAWPWIRLSIYQREDRHFGKALIAIGQAENRDESAAGSGPGAVVYYHKGWALQEANRPLEALIAFTRAISRNPDNVWLLYRRALAYEAIDNRLQAKRDLSRIVQLMPKEGFEPTIARKLRKYGFKTRERKDVCLPPDVDCEFH